MEKLASVQTHHNLNAVYRAGEPGPGGAHHDYYIYPADCDPETTELPLAVVEFQRGPRKDPEARPGVLDCDLLEIVRDRLAEFEAGPHGLLGKQNGSEMHRNRADGDVQTRSGPSRAAGSRHYGQIRAKPPKNSAKFREVLHIEKL